MGIAEIKSARITIPCITGAYTNVSATLHLLGSKIKNEAKMEVPLLNVPPTRSVTIATSNAQNDAGVFELNFRDERYMPFEGAGAVESEWRLELPKNFRAFDYSTIHDIILHISYTADYDGLYREKVEENIGQLMSSLESVQGEEIPPLYRFFSLKSDFPHQFHTLIKGEENIVDINIEQKHFPFIFSGKELVEIDDNKNKKVVKALFNSDEIQDIDSAFKKAGNNFFGEWKLDISNLSNPKADVKDIYIVLPYKLE